MGGKEKQPGVRSKFASKKKATKVDAFTERRKKDEVAKVVFEDCLDLIIEDVAKDAVKDRFITVEGRRIVDISHFAKQLFCKSCGETLRLDHITREHRMGL